MICSCKVQDAWSNMFQAPLAGNALQVTHNYPQLLLPIWSLCLLSLLRYIKSRGYSDSEKLATPQKWRNKKRSFDVTLLNSFESRDDVDFLTYNISTMTSTFCMWELFCKQKHWWTKSPWNSICQTSSSQPTLNLPPSNVLHTPGCHWRLQTCSPSRSEATCRNMQLLK